MFRQFLCSLATQVVLAAEMVALAAVRQALYIIGTPKPHMIGTLMGLALTGILGYIMTTPGSAAQSVGFPMRTQPDLTQARGFASGDHLPGAFLLLTHTMQWRRRV